MQVPAAAPVCKLSSVNLSKVAEPTFHVSRFYPTITRCDAPFTLVWQVNTIHRFPFVSRQQLAIGISASLCVHCPSVEFSTEMLEFELAHVARTSDEDSLAQTRMERSNTNSWY